MKKGVLKRLLNTAFMLALLCLLLSFSAIHEKIFVVFMTSSIAHMVFGLIAFKWSRHKGMNEMVSEENYPFNNCYSKPVLSSHLKIDKTKVVKTDDSLMHVKSIAECSLGAFCNTLTFIK